MHNQVENVHELLKQNPHDSSQYNFCTKFDKIEKKDYGLLTMQGTVENLMHTLKLQCYIQHGIFTAQEVR